MFLSLQYQAEGRIHRHTLNEIYNCVDIDILMIKWLPSFETSAMKSLKKTELLCMQVLVAKRWAAVENINMDELIEMYGRHE